MYSGWQLITWLSGGILRCWWLDDGRQVSASFHPSPFIKDGLIPGILNGGFFGVDRMWLWEPEQHMKWSDFEIRTRHPTNHKRKILGCGESGKCSCSNRVYLFFDIIITLYYVSIISMSQTVSRILWMNAYVGMQEFPACAPTVCTLVSFSGNNEKKNRLKQGWKKPFASSAVEGNSVTLFCRDARKKGFVYRELDFIFLVDFGSQWRFVLPFPLRYQVLLYRPELWKQQT